MTSPLVNPTSGYSTFSRLLRRSCRPSISTSTPSGAMRVGSGGLALASSRRLLGRLRRCLGGLLRRLHRLDGGGSNLVLGDVARTRGGAGTGGLRLAHACFERREEVDDLRSRRRWYGRLDRLLTGGLALDEAEHLLAVLVLELRGIECRCQRLDQLLGHRELALGDLDLSG